MEENKAKREDDDMISKLPDTLISEILFYLPTKEAVRTSVLSNRWRSLWLLVPGLDLDSCEFLDFNAFSSFVNKCLDFSRENELCLHKLKLSIHQDENENHNQFCVTRWIDFVAKGKLKHLDVERFLKRKCLEVIMPVSLFVCQTLVYLRLSRVLFSTSFEESSSVSLPRLKTLRLELNVYSNETSLESLISYIPVLEDLTIVRRVGDNVKYLRVRSQTLTSLRIKFQLRRQSEYYGEVDVLVVRGYGQGGFLIDAPRLKCMQTRSHKATDLVALSNEELGRLERRRRTNSEPAEMNMNVLPEGANQEGNNLPPPVLPEGGNNPQNVLPAVAGPIGLQLGPVDPRAVVPNGPPPGPVDPVAAAHPARTLDEQDTPDRFYANRSVLRPPNPTRQDYEIKYSLINLVQNRCFNGLATENPMDHIEAFEALCNTTKANGVPYDYLRLTLFKFSLADKALRWLKMLEPGSITTWNECRAKFLNHFYTKSRSARVREGLPHHGFTQESLMTTFYGGIDTQYQMALDTASKGDFSTNTVVQATSLIENLARSNSDHAPEYDRSLKVKAVENDALKDLTQKVNLLLAREQQTIKALEETFDEDDDQEEVNYIGGQGGYRGFNPNYRNHPNLSYRSNNVENPQDMVYPPRQQGNLNKPSTFANYPPKPAVPQENKLETMMYSLIESHKKSASEINAKIDGMYGDLNGKFTTLASRVDSLDKRVSTMASSSKGKEACNVVMAHSGANTSFHSDSPYPRVPKAKIDETKYNRFKEIMSELIKEVTLSEALDELPFLKKICRDVLNGTEDPAEVDAYLAKQKEASTLKLVKVEKQEDPGKFVVPCSIDGEVFANSLCDSGSSVNVMSMATVRRLDLQGMETSQCSLKFANASTTTPQGFIGDVEVRVGNHLVPTDFHVVEMSGGSETPLILGRAFLTTVGAVFDLDEPKMTFTKIDKNVAYYPVLEAARLGSCYAEVSMVAMKRTPRIRVNRQWPYQMVKSNCNCNPACFTPDENQEEISDEIHPHDLNMFEMRVRMVPERLSFKEEWTNYVGLQKCFWKSREPLYVIEAHFYRAREKATERRCLLKVKDLGCFVVPCAINGVSVNNCLCDSGAGTSVIPTTIASRCGITKCSPSTTKLYMADESVVIPRGELRNEIVRIGDVDVPTDFQVVDVPEKRQQVILGRAFLTTVGAVMDVPNRRVCFANVDKEVFYHTKPRESALRPVRL
ncbi:F-box domain [Arabidopsis thaliana x Arabidopsis arenosa]|uniref:F-box domain n=1 Tax=Arabidopsis thaliana x Arabidopsis arenosa TaxID=1240361 RepID=A0A8T1XJ36_9BRAS|nr:F-box domain [Arabidopsis thaliana x Arabidopsis arenosa]